MPVEVANGVSEPASLPNGDLKSLQNPNAKKNRDSERRRRRRKQKKNKKNAAAGDDSDTAADDADGTAGDSSKENSDPHKALELVEVEYVPEKAELDGIMDDELRKVFEKFNFVEGAATEDSEKKDDPATDAVAKKKDSDSEEEEQDTQQKEKGVSNKKKKLQRRMKIAELKQISTRPDVVEVWDATTSDPKLLVYLKSYRNTVAVPRHWCQKRKFLQGSCGGTCGAMKSRCLQGNTCINCVHCAC